MSNPPVSFILLTYNQERYVEEALQSTLDQDYPNLEILVCDDHSTDGTWDRVQEVAARYRGPHRVRLHRQPENLGVSRNNAFSIRAASGRFQISGHGDDVNLPMRVRRLVEVWQQTGAMLISHNAGKGESSESLELLVEKGKSGFIPIEAMSRITWAPQMLGATFGWDVRMWEFFGFFEPVLLPSGGDHVLPIRASMIGGFYYLHEPLVFWRRHDLQATVVETGLKIDGSGPAEICRQYDANAQLQRLRDIQVALKVGPKNPRLLAARTQMWTEAVFRIMCWSRDRSSLEARGAKLGWNSVG